MNTWQRWLQAPQTLWLRKAIFQIHLWLGIGFGLYVMVICITGSALVLSPLAQKWFVPSEVASSEGVPLSGAELTAKIADVYSSFAVIDSMVSSVPDQAVYVTLAKDGQETTRFFDQYRGEDLGDPFPWQVKVVDGLSNFHDDLLLGRTGRQLNGIGGILFILMAVTGMFIWWQGKTRWHQGLVIRRSSPRGLNWQLHSFTGFWSLFLIISWGISAVYFTHPAPFVFIIDALDNDLSDLERPDSFLRLMVVIHYGRFDAGLLRVLWALFGLLPVVLFVTGFLLWWRRIRTHR